MSIPTLSELPNNLSKLSVTELFNLIMETLATQKIAKSLSFLVEFVHQTGFDLSKEMISLSKHSSSLTISTKVARKVDKMFDQYNSLSNHFSKLDEAKDSSPGVTSLSNHVIHLLQTKSLTGLNVVLEDNKGNMYQYSLNDIQSLPEANAGLDILKKSVIDQIIEFSNNDNPHDNPHDNGSDNFPDDSGGDIPIDIAFM